MSLVSVGIWSRVSREIIGVWSGLIFFYGFVYSDSEVKLEIGRYLRRLV